MNNGRKVLKFFAAAFWGSLLLLLFLPFLFVVVYVLGARVNTSPGNGEKIGQIVKIERVGMICKTWEAQLIRGGLVGGGGVFGIVPFDFTIEDEEMAQKTTEYMRRQTEVRLVYSKKGVYWLCQSGSLGNFLKEISAVK